MTDRRKSNEVHKKEIPLQYIQYKRKMWKVRKRKWNDSTCSEPSYSKNWIRNSYPKNHDSKEKRGKGPMDSIV